MRDDIGECDGLEIVIEIFQSFHATKPAALIRISEPDASRLETS